MLKSSVPLKIKMLCISSALNPAHIPIHSLTVVLKSNSLLVIFRL